MKVGFALYDKTLLTSVTLACEMLLSANQLRSRALQRADKQIIEIIAPANTTMMGGLKLHIDFDYSEFRQYDMVILPPMWGNPVTSIKKHPQIIPWVCQQYRGGARILATGTGVCWLAESGLLDGQVATTHWYYYDKFEKRYPNIKLNREASIIRSNGLYCARSINAQTELIVYLISRYIGADIAKVIEKHYMHEVSRVDSEPYYYTGGELQFDEAVAIAKAYIHQHMAQPLTADKIAEQCGLSVRTLSRRFVHQLGETPHQYLINIRLQQAKLLFRDINLSISEIAEIVGYKDAHYFSTLFKRQFDISPKQYRQLTTSKAYT